ncbi:MAG TPA: hypothetical protein VFJ84_03000 [Candidatus Saccharimonadales bacterium]|nr:hypothetical protein [Candidatus Saccharimonadales bacterium]
MRARDPEVANLIAIEEPCAGCVLAEGHSVSPDYIESSVSAEDDIETTLTVSSYNGRLRTTEIRLAGVVRKEDVIRELNTPIGGKSVACNALCAMIQRKKEVNI